MSNTEAPARQQQPRPSDKDLVALGRTFKQGYRWDRSGGGHFRILDPDDRLVEHRGRPISVSSNPSPGSLRAFKEQIEEAKIVRGSGVRINEEGQKRQIDAMREANKARVQIRQTQANELRDRYETVFEKMGGLDTPGIANDLGRVAALLTRGAPLEEGRRIKTPDLLAQNAYRVVQGNWVEPEYAYIWHTLIERLEGAPDPVGEWYTLVRDARGLPSDTVELRVPKDALDEWPFRVELLPLEALLVDRDHYQRPVSWAFVRREAARYDPSLVGTIDVAQRSPSRFAVLDGQQRGEIVRLVGKTSIWASIYIGLDLQSEARFFLRKNRDRKTMHPYYTFRAMLSSGDEEANAINALVEKHGFKLAIGAPTTERSTNIAAIAGVTQAYKRKLPDGTSALDPALSLIKTMIGYEHAQSALMIRGLATTIAESPDLDLALLERVLADTSPAVILGRAREIKRNTSTSGEQAVVNVVMNDYNRAKRTRRKAAA